MDLIRSALPKEVVDRMDLASLDVIDASFVDEEQKQSQGDLLFSIDVKRPGGSVYSGTESKRDLQIYCLFEHKSYLEPGIYVQLIEYLARIYRRQWTAFRWFSPVIPLVFYHGAKEWNLGNRLLDQMARNSGLAGACPATGRFGSRPTAVFSARMRLTLGFSPETIASASPFLAAAR